ncbi:hypothetical protein CsatB_026513 [Cannabis sativa]
MGSAQPNRRESLRIALKKAGDEVKGAALASDAFFPFDIVILGKMLWKKRVRMELVLLLSLGGASEMGMP